MPRQHESIAASVLNFVGLSGSPVPAGGLAPRISSPQTQDALTREFQDFGQVVNPETWARFGNMMNRPATFTAMLDLWEQMAAWDLLAAALVQVVEEACQTDPGDPGVLWYECDDGHAEEELNGMLEDVDVETILPAQVYYTAALGNAFEKVDYARGEGVQGLSFVHPQEIRRYWLKRNRQCIGFRWRNEVPDKQDLYIQGDKTIPRTLIGSDNSTEELWYPWDFLHFRRMYRMRESEHGEPIFEEAQGIYKKLRIALDQMVVHRAQVQPDRYVVNIDVQEQPPSDQLKTVQRWKQQLRSKVSFGHGEEVDTFKSFYNALGLDSILYIARPKGYAHALEKLPGTANVPDVYDIEMLTNLFFSVIATPKQWLGIGQAEGGPASGRALLAQDVRFLRKIKSIRKPILNGYTQLGYFHLLLKGYDVENLEVHARMSDIGSLDDQMKIETLKAQAETLDILADVMAKFDLPREAWVEVIFRKYMRMPDEIINVFLTALPAQAELQGESRGPKPARSTRLSQLLRELDNHVKDNPKAGHVLERLKHSVNYASTARKTRRHLTESLAKVPVMKSGDVIVSSLTDDPFETSWRNGRRGPVRESNKVPSTGWRRYTFS